PDGTRILTASEDKTARLWNAATGKALGQPLRHDGAVERAQFSPDGMRIVTVSEDRIARLWDAATGKELSQSTVSEFGRNLGFSRDGTQIVIVGDQRFRDDFEARVLDTF